MGETNTRSAPQLVWKGDKFNNNSTWTTKNSNGEFFYQLPVRLVTYLMNNIHGNSGNVIKLLLVLIGSSEKFRISEKMILERTGMSQFSYIRARKALVDMGIITHINKPGQHFIILNYDYLWQQARSFEVEKKNNEEKSIHELKKSVEYNDELLENGLVSEEEYDSINEMSSIPNYQW